MIANNLINEIQPRIYIQQTVFTSGLNENSIRKRTENIKNIHSKTYIFCVLQIQFPTILPKKSQSL